MAGCTVIAHKGTTQSSVGGSTHCYSNGPFQLQTRREENGHNSGRSLKRNQNVGKRRGRDSNPRQKLPPVTP